MFCILCSSSFNILSLKRNHHKTTTRQVTSNFSILCLAMSITGHCAVAVNKLKCYYLRIRWSEKDTHSFSSSHHKKQVESKHTNVISFATCVCLIRIYAHYIMHNISESWEKKLLCVLFLLSECSLLFLPWFPINHWVLCQKPVPKKERGSDEKLTSNCDNHEGAPYKNFVASFSSNIALYSNQKLRLFIKIHNT